MPVNSGSLKTNYNSKLYSLVILFVLIGVIAHKGTHFNFNILFFYNVKLASFAFPLPSQQSTVCTLEKDP